MKTGCELLGEKDLIRYSVVKEDLTTVDDGKLRACSEILRTDFQRFMVLAKELKLNLAG
jgi:hypothetical protein